MTLADSPLATWMKRNGITVNRENYIEFNWDEKPTPWTIELENELPEELQDWSVFGENWKEDSVEQHPMADEQ